ncbi:MAG TPA: hypothetical protein VJX73_13045 [Terracidiphilus sp.]|nr:hypothetical protein [Terracidiphilus sp.]
MKLTKRMCLLAILGAVLVRPTLAAAPGPWEQPASELADQIAAILGPGQAHLTIRNLSSISNDEIPVIRRLLAQDLKAHGVVMAGAESANAIRVTLSEGASERILVAEVDEGNQSQVAIVDLGPISTQTATTQARMELHKEIYWSAAALANGSATASDDPVMALMEAGTRLFVLREDSVMIFARGADHGRTVEASLPLDLKRPMPRDPRGVLIAAADGNGFTAFTPGTECGGAFSTPVDAAAQPHNGWTVNCHASDEPWPIAIDASGAPQLKAFYNSARDYFTGVVSPGVGVDLPPFYAAVLVPRSAGSGALLIGGIDGKVTMAESGALRNVTGTRDWGSDFAVLRSGCGAGVQVIASGSGEAANDGLRAYELPALEAVPASAPLGMDGTVAALWTAPDGKSVLAVVRNAANQYEVDRVTALCN